MLGIAKKTIEEKEVRNREGLKKTDAGLYEVLRRRGLLGKVRFEEVLRKWRTDEEVLESARKIIDEKRIMKPSDLESADLGLYGALRRRGLLKKVRYEQRQREWGTDEEVIGFARKYMEENGVINRMGLMNAELGLYEVLKKKKLLDRAFAPIERSKHAESVDGVIDALDSFGDE